MNKKMRELQAQILAKTTEAKGFMEGENKDLDKAEAIMNEIDALQKELDLEARLASKEKAAVPTEEEAPVVEKASGFKALAKMLSKKGLDDAEKALISGSGAANGENLLIPEDVKVEINELRKTYVSAKELVTVETTDSLTGSVNYESGAPAGLAEFDDGAAITEEGNPSFVKKTFTIKQFGKLIPISRILLGAEKAGIMNYLNRWFVRNAVISENAKIFGTLKAGYNEGTAKAIVGWKALKTSINVDLDPSCLLNGVIVTNQTGFNILDSEEDNDGRPVLQANPAHPTQKVFQGLVVKVFPDAQLPNNEDGSAPIIYGDLKAGATFVEHNALEFTISEHYMFNKNQNCLRVLEGFDVMSTDTSAYVYGSLKGTTAAG